MRNGPFIALNCGALPSELIEAELFGAEAGAYTGANKPREGKFEAADGGTLFLDEIGTLPLASQVKLLRVLETGRFQRLGSNRERSVKVRIVSAANPRRLYRPTDVSWDTVSEPDNTFMDDDHFNALFDGDVLICVTGGPSGPLEPIMLRTRAARRDVLAWKRGQPFGNATEKFIEHILCFLGMDNP